ncbi:MAG: hypothetical protein GC159_03650 [Phycisphaera sp.]|nr:hypothetical protein [Phycisphaera sp.]
MTRREFWTCLMCAAMTLACVAPCATYAAADADRPAASEPKAAEGDASAKPAAPNLPWVHVDMANKVIDVDGTICLTEGQLELFATVLAGKEHEAVCTIKARPQNVHIAMLMIGLKSGQPSDWHVDDEGNPHSRDATGDKVHLSIVYEQDGKTIEKPIGECARHIDTKTPMSGSVFVFAGSIVVKPKKGDPYYAADATGDVVSLVSFEDEMLAMPKAASKNNDALKWEANTEALPKLGTPIKLRIRPAKEGETLAGQPIKPKEPAGQK